MYENFQMKLFRTTDKFDIVYPVKTRYPRVTIVKFSTWSFWFLHDKNDLK